MTFRTDARTISELLGDALAQVSNLVQNEVELAKAELAENSRQIVSSAATFAAGGMFVIPALVMAFFALATGLIQAGWSAPLSYLGSAILAAIIAAVFLLVGMSRLKARSLMPGETINQLRKDAQMAKRVAQ
ncbi:MAG: phage holin family protein [Acidobacteria bacterium]|nr:phage holin family protein [Acidobacteriota bacterium]